MVLRRLNLWNSANSNPPAWLIRITVYCVIPRAVVYPPGKAALLCMAETLRPDAAQHGIKVQIVKSGFGRAPMTDVNDFPIPFLLEPVAALQTLFPVHEAPGSTQMTCFAEIAHKPQSGDLM